MEFSDSTHPPQFNPSVLTASAVMISPFYQPWEQRLLLHSYLWLQISTQERQSGRRIYIYLFMHTHFSRSSALLQLRIATNQKCDRVTPAAVSDVGTWTSVITPLMDFGSWVAWVLLKITPVTPTTSSQELKLVEPALTAFPIISITGLTSTTTFSPKQGQQVRQIPPCLQWFVAHRG